jgi:hypothetical protein
MLLGMLPWLACALPQLGDGLERPAAPFAWGALVRSYYTVSPAEAGAGAEDLSGHVFEDAALHFSGGAGGLSWRLGAEFADGGGRIEDAYAAWRGPGETQLTLGQFRPRVLRSASLPEETLLFRERTFLGAAFDAFDDGLELAGHYDQFDGWFALTDSGNGSDSDHFWSLRGEWALYDDAWEDAEGARRAPNHLRVLLGAFLFEDVAASAADGGGHGLDVALTFGPYALHGEWADLEQDFARPCDVFNGHLVLLGDGDPVALTAARRLGEEFEAALRFQRAEDGDDTQSFGVGASWAPVSGAARFALDAASVEADSRDFTLVSVGIVLGSSGRTRPFLGAR